MGLETADVNFRINIIFFLQNPNLDNFPNSKLIRRRFPRYFFTIKCILNPVCTQGHWVIKRFLYPRRYHFLTHYQPKKYTKMSHFQKKIKNIFFKSDYDKKNIFWHGQDWRWSWNKGQLGMLVSALLGLNNWSWTTVWLTIGAFDTRPLPKCNTMKL